MYPTQTIKCQDRLKTFQTYKFSKIHILCPCLRNSPEQMSKHEANKGRGHRIYPGGKRPWDAREGRAQDDSSLSGPGCSILGGFGKDFLGDW